MGRILPCFFFDFFFPSNAHGLLQVWGHLASFTSLLVMRPFFAFRAKKPLHTGVCTGCHYLICLSVCVRVCNIRRFTDCERCTRPTSTNPVSMEAGKYGLTCGTCFVASRPEVVVAVAGLLSISWCVLGGVGLLRVFYPICFRRTHTACHKYEAPLPHLPLY